MPKPTKNLIGQKFGRLTVIERGPNTAVKKATWICVCDHGGVGTASKICVRSDSLLRGKTKSCGCLQQEASSRANRRHGYSRAVPGTREQRTYQAYQNAKGRCEDPNDVSYKRYGAIGAKFLFHSVEELVTEIGLCPPGLTLGRYPDKKGNYEPGNVMWATMRQQGNRRLRQSAEGSP